MHPPRGRCIDGGVTFSDSRKVNNWFHAFVDRKNLAVFHDVQNKENSQRFNFIYG